MLLLGISGETNGGATEADRVRRKYVACNISNSIWFCMEHNLCSFSHEDCKGVDDPAVEAEWKDQRIMGQFKLADHNTYL